MSIDENKMRSFENDVDMNGRENRYFSSKQSEIKGSPYKICDDYYVETRVSGNGIKDFVIRIIKAYGYKSTDFSVYFRADFSGLHKES